MIEESDIRMIIWIVSLLSMVNIDGRWFHVFSSLSSTRFSNNIEKKKPDQLYKTKMEGATRRRQETYHLSLSLSSPSWSDRDLTLFNGCPVEIVREKSRSSGLDKTHSGCYFDIPPQRHAYPCSSTIGAQVVYFFTSLL